MTSISNEYIYMPRDQPTFKRVVGEYTARAFPGCVGSVDCVHIGWDRCPTQYTNVYTGKEGFPSIAYEVICTSRNSFSLWLLVTQVREMTNTLSGRTTVCSNFYTAMGGSTPRIGSAVVQRVRKEYLEVCTSFAMEDIIVGPVLSRLTKIMCLAVPLCVGPPI
jgi:Plant transposon protein